jgi:Trp operon repressor
MTQVSKYPVSKDVQKRMYDIFLEALADVRMREDVEEFIDDFFTPTERVMLPKRLAIALLLSKGYEQRIICEYLKVSFTTITRISNQLKTKGAGFRRTVQKIMEDENLADFLEKMDAGLAKLLGPMGPGSLNRKAWYARKRQQVMASKNPF